MHDEYGQHNKGYGRQEHHHQQPCGQPQNASESIRRRFFDGELRNEQKQSVVNDEVERLECSKKRSAQEVFQRNNKINPGLVRKKNREKDTKA